MAVESPPSVLQAGSYSAEELRRMVFSAMLERGSHVGSVVGGLVGSTDLELSTGSGLKVKYAPGEIIVPGSTSTTQGGYYCRASSEGEVSLAAADGTNPRVDRVCAVVTDAAYAGTTNTFAISVVTGTPTAGATIAKAEKGEGGVGAAPASCLTLGYALVSAKATTVGEVKTTASRVKLGVAAESILTAMLANEAVTGGKLGAETLRSLLTSKWSERVSRSFNTQYTPSAVRATEVLVSVMVTSKNSGVSLYVGGLSLGTVLGVSGELSGGGEPESTTSFICPANTAWEMRNGLGGISLSSAYLEL